MQVVYFLFPEPYPHFSEIKLSVAKIGKICSCLCTKPNVYELWGGGYKWRRRWEVITVMLGHNSLFLTDATANGM